LPASIFFEVDIGVMTSREHVISLEARGKGLTGTLLRCPYELRKRIFRRHRGPQARQGHNGAFWIISGQKR
jgi:hypothetical protein